MYSSASGVPLAHYDNGECEYYNDHCKHRDDCNDGYEERSERVLVSRVAACSISASCCWESGGGGWEEGGGGGVGEGAERGEGKEGVRGGGGMEV